MDLFDQLDALSRPKVEKKPWMDLVRMELVTDDTLSQVVDECITSGLYALDLEATSLDNRVFYADNGKPHTPYVQIVGYCLSPDGEVGYYIPVRHRTDSGQSHERNLSPHIVAEEMRRLEASDAVAIFHNGKYDHELLQFSEGEPIGEWDQPDKWEDTLILAYLRNSRQRRKSLKFLSNDDLGMEMIELDELFSDKQKKDLGGRLDFSVLDPDWEPVLWYACSDAICTYRLFKHIQPQALDPQPTGQSQATVYQIEKMTVTATRWMERNRININRDKVKELIFLGQKEWFESLGEVYQGAQRLLGRDVRPGWFRIMAGEVGTNRFDPGVMDPGYMAVREQAKRQAETLRLDPTMVSGKGKEKIRTITKEVPSLIDKRKKEKVGFLEVYDVTIPAQLGLLLRELGVEGLRPTEASGQVKTSQDEIQRVIEYAEATFPFMKKIKRFREVAKALGSNLFPVWRDSHPSRSPDGTIRVGFNGLKVDTGRFATPIPRTKDFSGSAGWNLLSIPATYDKEKPECMLRMREVVEAREGYTLFACDYAGVELRVVTNLSGERLWLDEFFRCSSCGTTFERDKPAPHFCPNCGSDKIGDLHSLTAFSIYGDHIKGTPDFKQLRQKSKSLNFAMAYGGGGSAAQRAVDVDIDEGWRIKRQFDKTYKDLHRWWEAQHNFARKYKFVTTAFGRRYPLPDIDHENGKFRSKAERNAVNGPVQGCLHPNTRIMTREGMFTAKDLYDRGSRFDVWTGQGWSAASPLFSGEKPVRETQFSAGSTIKTSPEHLFLAWREHEPNPVGRGDVLEWVRQRDLSLGEWVARSTPSRSLGVPEGLIRWVGRTVYDSSSYAGLSRAEKSAVLRLKKGSGSRPQCLKYLQKVPKTEVPETLWELLRYDWEKVTGSRDLGETVEMYDVEVHDDFHAFVADGCVVHNTSADITKLAMSLLYKECKKRGWLRKVMMIITIHDELVIEIHNSILEEALEVIEYAMAKNPVLARLRHPVHYKIDVEFGNDWTVPFNFTEMSHNKGGGSWTPELAEKFPKGYQSYLAHGGTPLEGYEASVVQEEPAPTQDTPATPSAPRDAFEVPVSGKNVEFVYRIPTHRFGVVLLTDLARIINKCQGRGTALLRVQDEHGENILDREVRVNPAQFKALADEYGV